MKYSRGCRIVLAVCAMTTTYYLLGWRTYVRLREIPSMAWWENPMDSSWLLQEAKIETAREARLAFRNSEAWLSGDRLGNSLGNENDDTSLLSLRDVENFVLDIIVPMRHLDDGDNRNNDDDDGDGDDKDDNNNDRTSAAHSRAILDLAICPETSIFQDDASYETCDHDGDGRASCGGKGGRQELQHLVVRLVYLAIHWHQHRPAAEEALSRAATRMGRSTHDAAAADAADADAGDAAAALPAPAASAHTPVGIFDYECPNAKFLVAAFPGGAGFGHSLRNGAVNPLLLGLATGRVTLFINENRLSLASCPRGDMQCFFLPASPCVITKEELESAPRLNGKETDMLREGKDLPGNYTNERVIFVQSNGQQKWPVGLRESMAKAVESLLLLLPLPQLQPPDIDDYTKQRILGYVLDQDLDKWIINHAAELFLMRPNFSAREKLAAVMKKVLPPNTPSERIIGLPIRASDKCIKESECLSIDNYMDISKNAWKNHRLILGTNTSNSELTSRDKEYVLVTSESNSVIEQIKKHKKNLTHTHHSHPFDLLINEDDVSQGTGNPKSFKGRTGGSNFSADDVMLSTVAALKLQLHASHVIGNCYSNFHILLKELISRGCGASRRSTFECLQDNEKEEYRLCCQWTRSNFCRTRRNKNKKE